VVGAGAALDHSLPADVRRALPYDSVCACVPMPVHRIALAEAEASAGTCATTAEPGGRYGYLIPTIASAHKPSFSLPPVHIEMQDDEPLEAVAGEDRLTGRHAEYFTGGRQ
jgi:hypothetical protein